MTLYRLLDIKKTYARRTVLDIPSLEIESGKVHALLGPNGAGKTTLLNLLAFLETPSCGQLYFRSQAVRYAETSLQELRKKVVMVDQHPIMFSTSVYRNMEFGLKIRGIPKSRHERIIAESLDLVGMRQFVSAPAHRLSGGETQRVALARALALSPDVFLCDEPTSGIDAENREIVFDVLRRINREKHISLIFTTHDRTQASSLTRNVLVLEAGRLTATAYENVFTGAIEKRGDGMYRFNIRNGLGVRIPTDRFDRHRDSTKIYLDPAALKVIPDTEKGQPAGAVSAQVISCAVENDHFRIVVDAGVSLTALLSAAEYRAKRFMVGDTVGLLIPPESIHLL